MKVNRRNFLKTITLAGSAVLVGGSRNAQALGQDPTSPEFVGMLVDTTLCVGCRGCEIACNEANKLPEPKISFDDESVFEKERKTGINEWSVVNRYETEKGTVFVKRQCMHCNQPACASACLVKAMLKTKEGPVIWQDNKCIGCRYCMIACPFDIPKFEYNSNNPRIRKCILCYERLKKGEQPACAEACPTGATIFGTRGKLLEIARTRIYGNPDEYVHHIYGEHEVGGTGWMYLSKVPFEQLGFRMDLGITPYPELTKGFLSTVPLVIVIWPALLSSFYAFTKRREQVAGVESTTPERKETIYD